MIERKAAAKLVKRLSGLDFFPQAPEAQDALIDALAGSQTLAMATVVVDDWIATSREAPKPADLRAALKVREVRDYSAEEKYGAKPAIQCEACNDLGWLTDSVNGQFKACWCAAGRDAMVPTMVAKLNAKFVGGRREQKYAKDWCERHGLPQ